MLLPYIPPDPPAPNPSVHTIRVHPLSQSTNHHKLTSSQGERRTWPGKHLGTHPLRNASSIDRADAAPLTQPPAFSGATASYSAEVAYGRRRTTKTGTVEAGGMACAKSHVATNCPHAVRATEFLIASTPSFRSALSVFSRLQPGRLLRSLIDKPNSEVASLKH